MTTTNENYSLPVSRHRPRRKAPRAVPPLRVDPFWLIEAAAFVLLLYWGRRAWFSLDDWDFLAHRTIGNVGDLFRAHYQHWVTLPLVIYRLLWSVFGLRYTPYLAVLLILHLATAALLREVMLRAGVRRWLATLSVSVFVVFGAGAQNILSAFQMTIVGSVFFGLVQLLLIDHDGRLARRDLLGIAAGFAAVMCSGVGVAMVFAVAVAALLRRDWRIAVVEFVPPVLAYSVWFLSIGARDKSSGISSPSVTQVLRFVAVGVSATFGDISHIRLLGWLVALTMLAGLGSAFAVCGTDVLRRAASPLALLLGAVVLLIETGIVRAGPFSSKAVQNMNPNGPDAARQGRYVYLIAAMLLPAIAFGAERLLLRSRASAPVIAAILVIGVVGNAADLATAASDHRAADASRHALLTAPLIPLAEQLPRSIRPGARFLAPDVTLGWLIDASRAGRLPKPKHVNPTDLATETLRLALAPSATPARKCQPIAKATAVTLRRGQSITLVRGAATLEYSPPLRAHSLPTNFNPGTLTALAGPLSLLVVPRSTQAAQPVVLCI